MPGARLWAVAAMGLCFALRGRKFACGKQKWVKRDLLGVCQFSLGHLQPGLSSTCVINLSRGMGGRRNRSSPCPLQWPAMLAQRAIGPLAQLEPNLERRSTLHFPLKVIFHHCSPSFLQSSFGSVCGSGLQAGSGSLINMSQPHPLCISFGLGSVFMLII